jgi:hypothetical protein
LKMSWLIAISLISSPIANASEVLEHLIKPSKKTTSNRFRGNWRTINSY